MKITNICPSIEMKFNHNLLLTPIFRYDSEYLFKIGNWLLQKIDGKEFNKFPATRLKLKQKHQEFMEIYERAKIKEGQSKEKAFIKANKPFYRYRLDNKNDQRTFQKLDDRRKTSEHDRRNNKVSKIQEVK